MSRLHEASLVPDLASRVDDILVSSKGILAQRTHHPWIHLGTFTYLRSKAYSTYTVTYNWPGSNINYRGVRAYTMDNTY